VKSEIITDVISICEKNGTNAISTTDYLLLSGNKKTTSSVTDPENYTDEYINRDTIAVMNTPHAFRYGFLVDMYKEAVETGVIDTVEPHTTTLMYAMGKKIFFSKGSQDNIKITTKDDLEMFEGYVLEQQRKSKDQVEGDVIVFLADGFEICEGMMVVDILRRAGVKVVMASVMGRRDVKSSNETFVQADCLVDNVEFSKAKMIVLPGGRVGTDNLNKCELVKEQCISFSKDKYVAAVCSAPSILANLGLVNKATVHPDFKNYMNEIEVLGESVVTDGNIITGQGLASMIPFSLKLVEILVDKDKADKIADSICYRK
jgi:DJ-1 family protein